MNPNVEWIACPCGVHVDDCTYHRGESWMPMMSIDAPLETFMQFVERLKTTSFRQITKIMQRVDFVGEGPTKHRSVRIMALNWIFAELDKRDGLCNSWDSRYQTIVCSPRYVQHFVTAHDDPRFQAVIDSKGRFCWPEVTELLEAISIS